MISISGESVTITVFSPLQILICQFFVHLIISFFHLLKLNINLMDDRIALALTSHASRLFSPSFSRLHPLAQIFQKKKN